MNAAEKHHIRELFLHRQASYRLSEAAQLLGTTRGRLEREARADDESAYRINERWRFTWRQLAYLAFREWSLADIHEALGPDAKTALPPLLGLRSLTVRLPEYLVRAIELAATSDDTTIDDWLQHELMDFAGTVVEHMERHVPGYQRAYFYPGTARPQRGEQS